MRVLVTGHNGYIGTRPGAAARSAGHEVVGLDSYLYERCTLGDGRRRRPGHCARTSATSSSQHLEGFDAVIHLAALSNDPLGDLNPDDDLRHQPPRRRRAWRVVAKEAGVERFLFSSSCSLYGAAGDDFLDETRRLQPGHALRRVQGAGRAATSRELADDDFSPTYLRSATAYGVSARLRGDLVVNNLAGYAFTTGEVLIKSDGTPWRPLVHIEDISPRLPGRPRGAARARARRGVQRRPHGGELPHPRGRRRSSARSCPDSKVAYAEGAAPDKRNYRVNCDKIARDAAGLPAAVDRARRASRSSTRPTCATGSTLDDFRARASCASSTSRSCRTRACSTRSLRRLELEAARCLASAPLRPRRAPPASAVEAARLPLVRRRRARDLPRARASCRCRTRSLRRGRSSTAPRRATRSTSPSAPPARSCRSSRTSPPEELFVDNYLYFSSFSEGLLAHSREHALELIDERGLDAREPGGRARLQRRLPAEELRRARRPRARHRPAPDAGGGRRRGRRPDAAGVLRRRLARRLRRRGQARRRDHREQRDGAHADAEQLRRGAERSCSPTTAWRRSRTRTSRT